MSDPTTHPIARALPVQRIFAFALVYLLAWTLLPAWLGQSFALDVAESLSWGKEWQWGYYKHPPLAPIVLNVFYVLFGKFGPYLLSQLCIALTLYMVWQTGRRLLDPQRALLGTVLTMGVAYYNFPAIEFNHNIAQMPIWAALGYCFVAALQDGKLRQWIAMGVLAGLGMLTKYSIAVILLTFGLYVLASRRYRNLLLTPGPWLAVVLMVAIFAPHGWWLQESAWLPFAYASERSLAQGGNPRLEALAFPATQLGAHLPLLIVLCVAWWRTRGPSTGQSAGTVRASRWQTPHPSLLLALTLAPCLIVVLLGTTLGLRLRDMWGSPMWAFSGLLVVALLPDARLAPMQPKLLRGTAIWLVLVTIFMLVYMTWGAQLRKRAARVDWPAAAIAQQAEQVWRAHTDCPLDVVAGDYWLAGLISAHGQTRPSVLINGDARFSPWVDAQRLRARGALWVWQEKSSEAPAQPPQPLADVLPGGGLVQHEGVSEIAWPRLPELAPLKLHWRVYLPATCTR
ncbi:glycosyltransferase family 39 protein [Comamonas sp.]